jgi:hypothetical protein
MAIKASLLPGPVNSFLTLIALLISLAHCTAGELPSERNPLPWCNSTLLPGTPLGRDNAQGLLASSWILSDNVTLTALQQECWEKVRKAGVKAGAKAGAKRQQRTPLCIPA